MDKPTDKPTDKRMNSIQDKMNGIGPNDVILEDQGRSQERDEQFAEEFQNISQNVKQMSRKELEDLVVLKLTEAILKHSEAGLLHAKVVELRAQKDKMVARVAHLQKQVQEMSRTLKMLIQSNLNKDPDNLKPKPIPPIKFFRSVRLQVAINPSKMLPKGAQVGDKATNKSAGNGNGTTVISNKAHGVRTPNPGPVMPKVISPNVPTILSLSPKNRAPILNIPVNNAVKKPALLNASSVVSSTAKPNVDSVLATTVSANYWPNQLTDVGSVTSPSPLLRPFQKRVVYARPYISANQHPQPSRGVRAQAFVDDMKRSLSGFNSILSTSQNNPTMTSIIPQSSNQARPPIVAPTIDPIMRDDNPYSPDF